jgi:hypothetical protein
MPQDVDLEDRLIYGLTPGRFGYLVVAAISAIMLWNLTAVSPDLRLPGCVCLCAAGAVLGWGRLGGRPADRYLLDALLFYCRTYRPRRRRRRWSELVPVALPAVDQPASPPEPGP